ncbi:Hypothetical protein UVM_LOCUS285 [uncultured virus]|nr:Hypothetical protein UVM_LOCUS285 [uncultured virus]
MQTVDLTRGRELGRGGFGIVYALAQHPDLAVKVSSRNMATNSCRKWHKEYQLIRDFMQRIQAAIPNFRFPDDAEIVVPVWVRETEDECSMVMPRILPPDDSGPTVQAQLGAPSVDLVQKARGRFVGLEQIERYWQRAGERGDLAKAAFEIGTLMALLHYVGKNDAYDVELFLGHQYGDPKLKFFLADFDLSQPIDRYDDETIERMVWSLDAVPYFPRPEIDRELYDAFADGYARIADLNGLGNVAEAVLAAYE